ncbi:uncharacterized protein F5147DRAFT_660448 [Suillus discolor]|uniref:Uncharacterized protein n=1 Tax=Suillus discolor TaxID=1912936 RepID=A0A9P7ER30_9AGAM|nr:uncharacterized protein F5147DRAFT_660448 [Suillus discolor]KAG2082595.1 hypothetical protein F5147DRAFT_660448 [Suillus discolor]
MERTTTHHYSTTLLGDLILQTASLPTVDTSLYSLSSEEAAFFKAQIGIDGDEDLKRHILEVDSISVGVDARKAAADGFPAENDIASDIIDVINEFLSLTIISELVNV